MKVLLVKDVPGLGRSGDVKEVSDGYARNFLMLRNLALPATSQLLNKVQKEEKERQDKIRRQRDESSNVKNKLESKIFLIKARANKTSLFAAVHEKEIATVINEKTGLEIDPKQILIKSPIKALGKNDAEVKIFEDIKAKIKLDIQPL